MTGDIIGDWVTPRCAAYNDRQQHTDEQKSPHATRLHKVMTWKTFMTESRFNKTYSSVRNIGQNYAIGTLVKNILKIHQSKLSYKTHYLKIC